MEEYSGYVGLDGHKETISPALANPPGARTTNSQRGMSPKRPRDPRFFLAWMTSLAHQTSSSVFAVSNSPVPGLQLQTASWKWQKCVGRGAEADAYAGLE